MRRCLSSTCFAILMNGNAKGSYARVSRRLDGWKKVFLFLGGRITLIHLCLSHIPGPLLLFSSFQNSNLYRSRD